MYKTVVLATKCTDSYENFCTSLAWRSRRFDIVYLNGKVEDDEKTFILLLSKHNVSNRNITMQSASVQ